MPQLPESLKYELGTNKCSLLCVVFSGVKLSSLVGKKGSLDKLQSYWDVGFFLGASILACDNTRVVQASEKLFKLKAPIW